MPTLCSFDPATVRERATYLDAMQYSEGFQYVMINGVLVVERGQARRERISWPARCMASRAGRG